MSLGLGIIYRSQCPSFSDILGHSSALLPGAAYERDPTVDFEVHKSILYTMATCHSLRTVDKELLGDPLDVKMFEFSGWSFEELAQNENVSSGENVQRSPLSIVRPPAGLAYGIGKSVDPTIVGC